MKKTYYEIESLKIEVVITDRRDKGFGRIDALITPVAGSGEKWVYEKKLLKSLDPKKIVKLK